jgi:hypothetical protein
VSFIVCWLFHRREREVLIPGILPGSTKPDDWRRPDPAKRSKRAVRVLQPNAVGSH